MTSDFHVFLKRPTPSGAVLKLEANGKACATCRGRLVAVKEGHLAFHRW